MQKAKPPKTILFILAIAVFFIAQEQAGETVSTHPGKTSSPDIQITQTADSPVQPVESFARPFTGERPLLLKNVMQNDSAQSDVTPCVAPYIIEPDLGNIDNLQQFYFNESKINGLAQNGFIVSDGSFSEFHEIYEQNRYSNTPSFVTVDSLMHTYHLYFSYLLKNIETDYLANRITLLSERMLASSIDQYDLLKGSEWESAARRNVAFFTIGAKLSGSDIEINDCAADMVHHELDLISLSQGIEQSDITGSEEDYTQYIPRGYYAGDKKLEQYFQAMMWYGRIHFTSDQDDLTRSALLISKILSDDSESYGLWESVYAVTSFFSGAGDDMGICEYIPVMREVYGADASIQSLTENKEGFNRFREITASLPSPRINSLPATAGEDHSISGFRFMGQRFTIDAAIMQQLIYSEVGENSAQSKRMLPDVLDVPAALGSDTALHILEKSGASDFENYSENMTRLREFLSEDNAEENNTLWSASLYAGWLYTLRPLLTVKGEGYPPFMQTEEWSKKNLECFAGSFTELKHDTILYSKQVIAEMGGDSLENEDDRGYVEPEPLVYSRFASLADWTARGLNEYGIISPADEENLSRLSLIARQLWTISDKELKDETLTESEYDFIKSYGGNIEHFWYEAASAESTSTEIIAKEFPAAVVVDIASDSNGTVLEAATDNPSIIHVVVNVDGKLKIATGSVYSFYQFTWPADDRLTDSKWREMMGLQVDETEYYNFDTRMPKPTWTESYRY